MSKRHIKWIKSTLLPLIVVVLGACGSSSRESADFGDGLRISIDPAPAFVETVRSLAREFTAQSGIPVEIVLAPQNITERLNQYHQMLATPATRMDLYMVDVIWTSQFPGRFVDLKPFVGSDPDLFFPAIIENNIVVGELIALPWFASAGVLFYRQDLLEKYGYKEPPTTWDELEEMAARIQSGERAEGRSEFHGFIWQAGPQEALTCNFVEWYASHGAGEIGDGAGSIRIDLDIAERAISRATRWLGTISPDDLPLWSEDRVRNIFREGNVAFVRHWPFGIQHYAGGDSPVKDLTGAAPLPGNPSASCLGGWQLAVSRQSPRQQDAIRLLRFLTSEQAQRRLLMEAGALPSRRGLHHETDIVHQIPQLPILGEIFETATPRPSREFGRNYNAFSALVQRTLQQAFRGEITPREAAQIIDSRGRALIPD